MPILAGSKAGSLSLPAACPSPQLLPGWSAAPHAKSESPMPPRSAPHSAHHARPGPQCTPALRSDPPPGLPRTLWPDSFLESPHGALTLAPRGAHSCISWCTGPLRGGSCWPCPFPPLHTQPLRRAPGPPPPAPSQPPAWTPTHRDSQCPTPERPPSACSGHGEAQPSGHTHCYANEEAARPGCSRVRAEPAVAVTGTRWPQRWRGPHTATCPPRGPLAGSMSPASRT